MTTTVACEAPEYVADAFPDLARILARQARSAEIGKAIATASPFPIPSLTLLIMGNDLAGGEEVVAAVKSGEIEAERAPIMFGSYARMGGILELCEAGHLTRDRLLDLWPSLWPSGDPDDTDPRFTAVWIEAWRRNGGTVYDRRPAKGRGLPRRKTITVYRGQPIGAPIGCSWSLDRAVAERFARGAGARRPVASGEVIEMVAHRSQVLAYLTGRGESEVIIDPRSVARPTEVA